MLAPRLHSTECTSSVPRNIFLFLNDFTFPHPIQSRVLEHIDCLDLFTFHTGNTQNVPFREEGEHSYWQCCIRIAQTQVASKWALLECSSLLLSSRNIQFAIEFGFTLWGEDGLCFSWLNWCQLPLRPQDKTELVWSNPSWNIYEMLPTGCPIPGGVQG